MSDLQDTVRDCHWSVKTLSEAISKTDFELDETLASYINKDYKKKPFPTLQPQKALRRLPESNPWLHQKQVCFGDECFDGSYHNMLVTAMGEELQFWDNRLQVYLAVANRKAHDRAEILSGMYTPHHRRVPIEDQT